MMVDGKKINIRDIMREAQTVSDKANFKEVLTVMICKKTNSLLVIDESGKFVGMVNARTLIHKSIPKYLGEDSTAAHFANEEIFKEEIGRVSTDSIDKIMDEDVMTIKENESLMKAAMIVGSTAEQESGEFHMVENVEAYK